VNTTLDAVIRFHHSGSDLAAGYRTWLHGLVDAAVDEAEAEIGADR
jgi:hypothetical protein